ncbi:MAG TPA: prepilin-type N-terminal cleavage/methylation domain-containing protein [Phycisphaerae bacterium]|nr:prepilin-type N-terminal cleavage/methylation domain-containing protein [Phycisphaerae bacterium]
MQHETDAAAPRRGFSLIELLVSIAIISVLLAILLPAMPAARRAAQLSKCMSNMRQICAAVLMYNTDNDGYFPRTMEEVSSDFPTTISWWAIQNYQMALTPYINMDRGGAQVAGHGNNAAVWFDPADPDASQPAMWGSFEDNGLISGVIRKDTRIGSPSMTVYATLREKDWAQINGIAIPEPLPVNDPNDPFWTSEYFDMCLDPWSQTEDEGNPYYWSKGLATPPRRLFPSEPYALDWDVQIDGRNPAIPGNLPRYGDGQPYSFCDGHVEKMAFERTYAGPMRNNMWSIK